MRGLAAGLLVVGIAVGVPAALVLVVGNPIPHLPPGGVGNRVPFDFVLDLVVCVVWLAWAQLATCLVAEFAAGIHGSGLPWRVPFAVATQQDFARRLATAVLLVATAGHGLQPAPESGKPVIATSSAVEAVERASAAALALAESAVRQRAETATPVLPSTAGTIRTAPAKRYVVRPPEGRHHDSLWDIAERYLGSGRRYRELFALNEGRLQPDGRRLTLASLIRPGWTLLMPADARGEGLVDVPAERLEGATRSGAASDGGRLPESGGGPGATVRDRPTPPAPAAWLDPAADLPWDLVGAELLAAGLLEALVALRRRRAWLRRPGSPIPTPDDGAAAVEVAVRLGADQAGADYLDRALRALARALAQGDRQVPEVYAARLSADALELLLAVPQESAPPPFLAENGGRRWVIDRSTPLPDVDTVPAPLPGLVSIGGDGYGRVFVDLEAAGGAICVAGDADLARSVVAAAGVELVTNRWSDDLRVTLVGFGSELAPISDRLRCVESLDEVWPGLTGRLAVGRQVLASAGIDSVLTGRVRGRHGLGLDPDFLVLGSPPPADQIAQLQSWAHSVRRAPLGILVAGSMDTARWRFDIDDHGVLDTGVLGLTVGAQLLTARSYAALAGLLRAEAKTPGDVAAAIGTGPGADGPDAPAGQPEPPRFTPPAGKPRGGVVGPLATPARPRAPVLPRPVDLDRRPVVLLRIFGEPAAEGPHQLPLATPLALEIASYLALTGGASRQALAASIWPHGVTTADLDSALARIRDWLGDDADGQPQLRRDEDGWLFLSPEVQLDWHLFVALVRRGGEADLVQALDLCRGPLVEPRPPRRYAWLGRDPVTRDLPALAVDVAHWVSTGLLARGSLDGAIAAARAGLRVERQSGQLWEDLLAAVRERDGQAGTARVIAERAAALGETDGPRRRVG